MKGSKSMNLEERKLSIIQAVLPIFARDGYEGARSTDLSKASGVTDSMIYKIFSSKKELYDTSLDYVLNLSDPFVELIINENPGIDRISRLIFTFLDETLKKNRNKEIELSHKLILKSLASNPEFARTYFLKKMSSFNSLVADSVKISIEKKEIISQEVYKFDDTAWIIHHLLMAFSFFNFSEPILKLYNKSNLALEALKFCLLGIGYKSNIVYKCIINFENKK